MTNYSLDTHLPEMSDYEPVIIILGAGYETCNMGVDALVSGTIASIVKVHPDRRVAILEFGHQPHTYEVADGDNSIHVKLENIRFSWKLWLRNNIFRLVCLAILMRFISLPKFCRWCLARHPALETVHSASLAVSLAGGDSFSDIYGFRRLLYVCMPQLLVLAMRRPLVLLPQTLGPFKAGWAKVMGRFIMARAQRVFSRDQASLEMARAILGPQANHLDSSPDMAFALEPAPPAGELPDWAIQKKRPLVGLNVSGLLYVGGYTKSNMFGLQDDYPALMRELIRWFTQTAGADVVLITHVTAEGESDAKACAAIHAELESECSERLHLADPGYNHREIKYLIGQCDFFLGARMHACIAALSQGVPAVGLAYSRKFAGVFESIGAEKLVIDLRNLSNPEVMRQIEAAYNQRGAYKEKISVAAAAAREAALDLFTRMTLTRGLPCALHPERSNASALCEAENASESYSNHRPN